MKKLLLALVWLPVGLLSAQEQAAPASASPAPQAASTQDVVPAPPIAPPATPQDPSSDNGDAIERGEPIPAVQAPAIAPAEQPASSSTAPEGAVEPAAHAKYEDGHAITRHALTIDGQRFEYTARAGRLKLETEEGQAKADVFFIAYTRDGVTDLAQRPLTFSFNGGPGSSSVWLHMGALGPRRVHLEPDGWAPPPPYVLVDNEHSWLDVTDLVFIDPVTTGYSRAAKGEEVAQFHGFKEDVDWMAEFIRLYTTRFERWSSPKYLAGESYGTTRAAGLAGHLQERHGMYLNGIVLVSSILNFLTTEFDPGNDLPYPLILPTYTATAWYHKRLAPELQANLRATLEEVEHFALGEYLTALARGDTLSAEERERLTAKLGRYTGLALDYIDRSNARVEIGRFTKELLRDERRTIGRLDSRFRGIDVDSAGEHYEYDASYAAIQGPFTATVNEYLRRELGYESDLPYEILTGRVRPWKMGADNRYVNVGETLRQAMTRNPRLRLLVASGYYDLATPYFAAEYTFHHLGLDPSLRGNLTFARYEGGHMMYIHDGVRAQFKKDVATFFRAER